MATTPNILANTDCAGYQVMMLLGNKWTIRILVELTTGVKRYGQLHSALAGVSHKMLSQTVRALEQHRLITREVFQVVPPHVEYSLTDLGRSLYGQLLGVAAWAEENSLALGCLPGQTHVEAGSKGGSKLD